MAYNPTKSDLSSSTDYHIGGPPCTGTEMRMRDTRDKHRRTRNSTRWSRAINERLTVDRITAYQSKRAKKFTELTKHTWRRLLK
jgi:hypothetical protein